MLIDIFLCMKWFLCWMWIDFSSHHMIEEEDSGNRALVFLSAHSSLLFAFLVFSKDVHQLVISAASVTLQTRSISVLGKLFLRASLKQRRGGATWSVARCEFREEVGVVSHSVKVSGLSSSVASHDGF